MMNTRNKLIRVATFLSSSFMLCIGSLFAHKGQILFFTKARGQGQKYGGCGGCDTLLIDGIAQFAGQLNLFAGQ